MNRCSSLKRKNGIYERQIGPEREKATEDNESADVAALKKERPLQAADRPISDKNRRGQ